MIFSIFLLILDFIIQIVLFLTYYSFLSIKKIKEKNCLFLMYLCILIVNYLTAYPAVYGQFPQAIPQPMAAVAPAQREGKIHVMEWLIDIIIVI